MSKVDQLRALREAAATAASFPIKEVTARQVVETWATKAADDVAAANRVREKLDAALARLPAPASTTYQYRDPDKRRAYMREYAKKRRALKAAERAANKEQGA